MFCVRRDTGQGLVEYALILVLVAVVVIAVLLLLGPAVGNVFSTIIRNL
jgi:pilus assembly protein Flp/PilA